MRIEFGSLLIKDLANSISSSSGTAPIRLMIFNWVIGGGSKLTWSSKLSASLNPPWECFAINEIASRLILISSFWAIVI